MSNTKLKVTGYIIAIAVIFLSYIWTYRFLSGFMLGMIATTLTFLFPSDTMLSLMDLVGINKKSTINHVLQEDEHNQEERKKRTVSFKDC